MNFPAWYASVVDRLMFAQWAFFLIARQVPELKTERVRVLFHIAKLSGLQERIASS
jgi:hypothetical protein